MNRTRTTPQSNGSTFRMTAEAGYQIISAYHNIPTNLSLNKTPNLSDAWLEGKQD